MAEFIFNKYYQIQVFKNLTNKQANNTKKCKALMQCLDLLAYETEYVKRKGQQNAVTWYVPTNSSLEYVIGFLEYNKATELMPIFLDKKFYLEWLKPYYYTLSVKLGCGNYYKIKIKHETFRPNQITELSHMVACYYQISNYLNLYQETEDMYVLDHLSHNTSINCRKYIRVITQQENLNNRRTYIKFMDESTFLMKNSIFDENRRLKFELMTKFPKETMDICNAINNGNLYLIGDNLMCTFPKGTSKATMMQLARSIDSMTLFDESTNYNPFLDFSDTWLFFALYINHIITENELARLQQEYFWENKQDTFYLYDMQNADYIEISKLYLGSAAGVKPVRILHYQGREIVVQ